MWQLEHTPNIFHDLTEIFEFLCNLPITLLYRWQEAQIYYNGCPVMMVFIRYENSLYLISYLSLFVKNKKIFEPIC